MRRILAPLAWATALLPHLGMAETADAVVTPPFPQPPLAGSAPALQRTVDLRQALERALADHPTLRAARLEVESVAAARQQAGARPNPTLGVEVEDTARRDTRTTTVLLSQPIELGGKRSARLLAAERAQASAQAQLEAQQAQVRAQVTGAYFDALLAQEKVRLAEASLALAQGGADAATKRVTAGKISPVEETKARVAASGVRVELLQAQGESRLALLALSTAMGLPAPAFDRVEGDVAPLPAPPDDAALSVRLATAPALRQAQLEAERFSALAEVERSRGMPDLTLSLGSKRSAELGRNQAVVGLSMPLPLFDRNQGAQLEALKRSDKARAEAQVVAQQLQLEALQAQERLRAASAEVELLRQEVLPGAQSAYGAASKGFELGKFSFLEVLDAQRTLLQVKTQYLHALALSHRAAIDLDRLLGQAPDDPTAAPRATPQFPATRPTQP